MDEGYLGSPTSWPIRSLEEGEGGGVELKAVAAAEKSMFIKRCRSVAGDLWHSGELVCRF